MNERISAPALDGILAQIRYRPSGANPIEARIAAAILQDPQRVSRESIVSFARRTSVSTGSVVRFAKLLGLAGYQELRLALAAQAGDRPVPITDVDRTPTRFRESMDEQVRAMLFAIGAVEPAVIEKAALLIARAGRVDIVGTGSSAAIGQAMLFSLTLMGLHVRFLPESSEQSAAAAFLGANDVLIAVSFSGRTRLIVDAASRAREAGASVVAITCNPKSGLLKSAAVPVVIDAAGGRFSAEWPLRTAMYAVARTICLAVGDELPPEEMKRRRAVWTTGRFGMRYRTE